jgi:hypothetical protein
MPSFKSERGRGSARIVWGTRQALVSLLLLLILCPSHAEAQQTPLGFAVERLYPSAAGGGWFVMDDLDIDGGFGGAVAVTSGYARNPLEVRNPNGSQRLSLVSGEAFVDVGIAATYHRVRVYLNLPMPLLVSGQSGTLASYQWRAPAVNVGTNPDTISDSRVGFDVRLLGAPGERFRMGVGAQLIIPSGDRADYVTDGTSRGMFRLLAAGDVGRFSYAGQVGLHLRPVADPTALSGPSGNELLFGVSAGRTVPVGSAWVLVLGPEIYGETATRSFGGETTGVEGLLTGRFERTTGEPHLRVKAGVGWGLDPHFGAPQWRVVFGVERIGHRLNHVDAQNGDRRTHHD